MGHLVLDLQHVEPIRRVEKATIANASLSKTRPKRSGEGFLVVFRATFFGLHSGYLHQLEPILVHLGWWCPITPQKTSIPQPQNHDGWQLPVSHSFTNRMHVRVASATSEESHRIAFLATGFHRKYPRMRIGVIPICYIHVQSRMLEGVLNTPFPYCSLTLLLTKPSWSFHSQRCRKPL